MRKTMAKILSVVCVIALVLSLCTFSVMSEESVLGALTAEKLAVSNGVNQIPSSIVSNLTLPEIDGVTWSSSNPDVLTNDGTVTRPVATDADVTLTATTGTEEKAFNFTVKARTTEVMYQDSFAYASKEEFISTGTLTPWNINGTDTVSGLQADADGNQYANFDFETSDAVKRKSISVSGDMIYLDFDTKPGMKDAMLRLTLKGKKLADDSDSEYTFALIRFLNGAARPSAYESVGKNFGTYNGTDFYHVKAKIDMVNKQFWVSFNNGAEVGPYTMVGQYAGGVVGSVTSTDYSFETIDAFNFARSTAANPATSLAIDNFVISKEVSADDVIASLPEDELVSYITDDLNEKFPLADNAALSPATFELPTYGGLVSWTDANGNTLSESVTLSQNQKTFNTGKLIATITPTGGEAKTYTYSYSVVPAEMTARTRVVANVGTFKSTFNFDGEWEAPQVMNNTPYTNMEFKVLGATGSAIPANVIWTTEFDGENEVANKVAKFSNTSGADKTVALTQGGGPQENLRMQVGADFKLTEGNKVTVNITGAETTVGVPMDFEKGTFTLTERSNDVTTGNSGINHITTYNLADYGVEQNTWNRIEIDYSPVGFVYDVYLNGTKVNSVPLNFGNLTGNGVYWANTFRFLTFTIPTDSTVLLDNVTVAETAAKNVNAVIDGTLRRIDKNFSTENAFANGETLYNDLVDADFYPGTAFVYGATNNTNRISSPAITWKLDGVTLPEVDGRVPLSFTGMGTHTLEASVQYYSTTVTKSWTITGAPVALRALDTNIPEVKIGSNVSGKFIVAKYTDETMKTLDGVRIYNYTSGINESGAFDFTEDNIGNNIKLFFINNKFEPIAYSVAR